MVDLKIIQKNWQYCHKQRKKEMQISFDVEVEEF